ncbi:hypothetical protein CHS0354_027027 [Potamilus streckersoni]|uniref:Uncharacterized protein n=1 Tax=Potamilus streckersoni TaxID=2493646 RepID=A0AAE0SY91_9BIVA|nr:hypothetical protein CHS0354_027027 [Potamilus streckersoni]
MTIDVIFILTFAQLALLYNKIPKKEEKAILEQGILLPIEPLCTSEPLPSPVQKPVSLPASSIKEPFIFLLPINTAGQSKPRSQPVCIVPAYNLR